MKFLNISSMRTVLFVCIGTTLLWVGADATVHVVATTTDLGDIARTIGGSRVRVETICKGAQDPHYVQARPSYMVKLSRADLLVSVGLELEVGWLPLLVQGSRNPDINPGRSGYLDASTAIIPIDLPQGQIDRSHGDVHPFGNPHYWLDPENAKSIAGVIADRLSSLDPEGAHSYRQNLQAFGERMDKSLGEWAEMMAPYRGTKVVSYHRTFNYFLSRFGLVAVGFIEERPGIPPAAAHLARLIQRMQSDSVHVIFHEPYFSRATSDLVGRRTGARVLVLPTSVGGTSSVESYDQLIDHLVRSFVAAQSE